MARVSSMVGHPREPETFEFVQTTWNGDNISHRIRSYVVFDERWPAWKRRVVFWLSQALQNLTNEPALRSTSEGGVVFGQTNGDGQCADAPSAPVRGGP